MPSGFYEREMLEFREMHLAHTICRALSSTSEMTLFFFCYIVAPVPTGPQRRVAFLVLVVLAHGEIASARALSRLLAQARMSLPSAFARSNSL